MRSVRMVAQAIPEAVGQHAAMPDGHAGEHASASVPASPAGIVEGSHPASAKMMAAKAAAAM